MSNRLRPRDIRGATQLLGEISELGSIPMAWRRHLLEGMCRLIDAQVALSIDLLGALPGKIPQLIEPLDLGWATESDAKRYYDYVNCGDVLEDPSAVALFRGHLRTRFQTHRRREMVDDRQWYTSPTVSEARRSAQIDDFICSTVSPAPGALQGFIFYRPWGAKAFEPKERRLVRFFHASLLRALRAQNSSGKDGDDSFHLSRRLRQTLDLLVAGDSMKQIAAKLGLSPHTVNDYMKLLYKRLGVSSRAELIRKCPSRRNGIIVLPAPLAKLMN